VLLVPHHHLSKAASLFSLNGGVPHALGSGQLAFLQELMDNLARIPQPSIVCLCLTIAFRRPLLFLALMEVFHALDSGQPSFLPPAKIEGQAGKNITT
jgi:hypothetical protein